MISLEALTQALKFNQTSLPQETLERLIEYGEHLLSWNQKLNLISRASSENLIYQHLVDSALIAQFVPKGKKITDLGSGGGLPGIVIAIIDPESSVQLSETKAKKINFLLNSVDDLNLKNVLVFDAAHQAPAKTSEILVCRAFANIEKIIREGKKYLIPGGEILAFKGKISTVNEELKAIPKRIPYRTQGYELKTPTESHERTLVTIRI